MTTKRLKRRAHGHEPNADSERLSLAPLTFKQALEGALATKPVKEDDSEKHSAGADHDG